jgi:hypothetical protein
MDHSFFHRTTVYFDGKATINHSILLVKILERDAVAVASYGMVRDPRASGHFRWEGWLPVRFCLDSGVESRPMNERLGLFHTFRRSTFRH